MTSGLTITVPRAAAFPEETVSGTTQGGIDGFVDAARSNKGGSHEATSFVGDQFVVYDYALLGRSDHVEYFAGVGRDR